MSQKIRLQLVLGFLGSGKSTLIANWLKAKPVAEPWAVFVNEFGELGFDGLMLQAQGVSVREVSGGCMCCSAILPAQMALNQLIRKQKPARLFIEPSGLASPKEILELVRQPQYEEHLDIQPVITVVDARVISQSRYREHALFRQQLQVADVIVASKADLYSGDELENLTQFAAELGLDIPIWPADQAGLPLEQFASLPRRQAGAGEGSHDHGDFISYEYRGEGDVDAQALALELHALPWSRIKGFVRDGNRAFMINAVEGEMSIKPASSVYLGQPFLQFIASRQQVADEQAWQQQCQAAVEACRR